MAINRKQSWDDTRRPASVARGMGSDPQSLQPAPEQRVYGNGRQPQRQSAKTEPQQAARVYKQNTVTPNQESAGDFVCLIVACVLSVLGLICLIVGVFILKDPAPEIVFDVVPESIVQPEPEQAPGALPEGVQTGPEASDPPEGETEDPQAQIPDQNEEQAPQQGEDADAAGRNIHSRSATNQGERSTTFGTGGDTGTESDVQSGDGQSGLVDTSPANQTPALASAPAPGGETTQKSEPKAHLESKGFNLVKLILTVAGIVLLTAGAVMGIIVGFLQRKKLAESVVQLAELQGRLNAMMGKTREPTTEEKLRYAFEQIPTLTEVQSDEMLRRAQDAVQQRFTPPAHTPPVQRKPADPVETCNAYLNDLLSSGAQKATQTLMANPEFEGASIDINNTLNVYRAGQKAPYHVVTREKDLNAQYLIATKSGAPVALYPNPYVAQYLGIRTLQNTVFVLEAFRIMANGREITPQTVDGAEGLTIRRVTGALLDHSGIVVRKGTIELG